MYRINCCNHRIIHYTNMKSYTDYQLLPPYILNRMSIDRLVPHLASRRAPRRMASPAPLQISLESFTSSTPLRWGRGTADWDTAASNRSTGNCLSKFNKRTGSKSSNWEIWARWGFPTVSSPFRSMTHDATPAALACFIKSIANSQFAVHFELLVCWWSHSTVAQS